MSLPRFNVLVLSLSIGIASVMVGCSSNPKKVTDAGPQSSEQIYYEKAIQALDKGQYTEASKQLEALDTYFPTGQYTQQAQLDLMYTRFKQADYAGAIALADRFIRLNPQHSQVDYAYYLRGVSNMELNYDGLLRYTSLKQAHRDTSYLKVAYQNFTDFIRRFPSSKYAVDAAQRMKFIGEEIAESEMNIARFNIERKAWVAAIQRARWVVEYYPQAPQIPEAIATLAYAYQQIGDQSSSQQYTKLLQTNYPQLIKRNGEVNLRAARNQGSLFNRFTLGILGRSSNHTVNKNDEVNTSNENTDRSWLNRLSFGLLDDDEEQKTSEIETTLNQVNVTTTAPVVENTPNENTTPENRLSNLIENGKPRINLALPDQTSPQGN